jgi:hypothetical protein
VSDERHQRYWEDVHEGDTLPPLEFPLSLTRVVVIAGGVRDFTPIHHNSSIARKHGAADIFLDNTTLFAMWERAVRGYIGLGGTIRSVRGFRIVQFNTVGNTPTVRGWVTRKWQDPRSAPNGTIALRLQTETSNGLTVGPGTVEATLPCRDA